MCWKILRTNENGSIRMIYNGIYKNNKCSGESPSINSFVNTITYKEGNETKTLSLNGKYNLSNNDNAYVDNSQMPYNANLQIKDAQGNAVVEKKNKNKCKC
jgi:hypothetical protein